VLPRVGSQQRFFGTHLHDRPAQHDLQHGLAPEVTSDMPTPVTKSGFDPVPMRIHPRVFAALGADLVTNDIVAVIELVKNAYDAFAHNVWLRFESPTTHDAFIEIRDDGCGMSRTTIENAWCCIATPHKEQNPIINSNGLQRRVTGEKGLGRLAVARLGSHLNLLTKVSGGSCWEVDINWNDLASHDDLSDSFAYCRPCPDPACIGESGTRLRIFGMAEVWNEHRIGDLRENLSRLISPFSEADDFAIYLTDRFEGSSRDVRVEPPKFLSTPKYSIKGCVDSNGNVKAVFRFSQIMNEEPEENELTLSWAQIFDLIQDKDRFSYCDDTAHCGKFRFDIRAWDLDSEGITEISQRFELHKSAVRKAIRMHKGISIYRDKVLVLPKSENSRDWLGLDLRRVSRVGTRLSTSQIIGSVFITKQDNPNIDDTSDRERLVSCREVSEFEEILKAVIGLLEIARHENRAKPDSQQPLLRLLEDLSTKGLTSEVINLSKEGAMASDVLPVVREFERSLHKTREHIERYFVYYSRLATVGTIAHMLVHEVRNRTTAIGAFIRSVTNRFGPFADSEIQEDLQYAGNAISSLERLADTFAPLASRSFRRRKRHSVVEDRVKSCLHLYRREITRKHITCDVPESQTAVAVDPGELDAVILNLVTNALYWMANTSKDDRLLRFRVAIDPNTAGRARISVSDHGAGISQDDLKRVFLPGMTKKPGGIGMGLTVASELVAVYGGKMAVESRGLNRGAEFAFDLPLAKKSKDGKRTVT